MIKTTLKKKFIPDYIRKLLRKKLELSKQKLASDNWKMNPKVLEELEERDYELSNEYN